MTIEGLTAGGVEQIVRERYAAAAVESQASLCCPVEYDARYLEVLPQEILERDYGCGDPTHHLRAGETVLDLGSGAGKICFIASQVVGPEGRVIGVDVNDEMLGLARRHRKAIAMAIGWDNVEFRRGRIEDLALDLDRLDAWLVEHPVTDANRLAALDAETARLRREQPLIDECAVDVVVSNCVLNLVADEQKRRLFREIYRVLNQGGRAIISDIVADEPVPDHLKADPDLWSGCVSGALTEMDFLRAFEDAGFHGIELLERGERPWRTVEGIEFRSVTVSAHKGKQGICLETNKAVIYRGPWKSVEDDDGHRFERGERAAVCEKTFRLLAAAPYAGLFEPVLPHREIPLEEATPFDCSRTTPRHPKETKGQDFDLSDDPADGSCGPACC